MENIRKTVAMQCLRGTLSIGTNANAGGKKNQFNPSAISIHPVTNEIYMIGSNCFKIMAFSWDEEINKTYFLNENLFKKPEEIAFSPTTELFISSEGKRHKMARICRFPYRPGD